MKKDIEYYMSLPWTYNFEFDPEDSTYFVRTLEVKCCTAEGETQEEAFLNYRKILRQHLEVAIKENIEIVEPVNPQDYKGNISYRTTPEKHFRLAKKAKKENISINKH